jgi:hypothetical protein
MLSNVSVTATLVLPSHKSTWLPFPSVPLREWQMLQKNTGDGTPVCQQVSDLDGSVFRVVTNTSSICEIHILMTLKWVAAVATSRNPCKEEGCLIICFVDYLVMQYEPQGFVSVKREE